MVAYVKSMSEAIDNEIKERKEPHYLKPTDNDHQN